MLAAAKPVFINGGPRRVGIQRFSYVFLLWAPWTLVGSVLLAPIFIWYITGMCWCPD